MHTQANGQTRIVAFGVDSTSGNYIPLSVSSGSLNVNIYPTGGWTAKTSITNSGVAVALYTPSGGNFAKLLGLQINSQALGGATTLQIINGNVGTVLWEVYVPVTGLPSITPVNFPSPLSTTVANEPIYIKSSAAVTGTIYINAQGYASAT